MLVVLLLLVPVASWALDSDLDGLEDDVDNCIDVANPLQCDTDQDGFGNGCDADYDQSGGVGSNDYSVFIADFQTGVDSGVGTDADCSGSVNAADHAFVVAQFSYGMPGPSGLLCSGFVPCVDVDHDGVADHLDNCAGLANAAQCDTDLDGYGNHCDGDFDNGGTVNANDFSAYFIPDFETGIDSGVGTDMDCGGTVNAGDYSQYFLPQFSAGLPGPSGLACAGSVPCEAGDPDTSQELAFSDLVSSSLELRIDTDGQGRMHGVYRADTSGSPRVEYVRQADPAASLERETIRQASVTDLDVTVDAADRPCVVMVNASTGDAEFGCLEASGFEFEAISPPVVRSSNDPRVVVDSQDAPHVVLYQHVPLDLPPNHRVRHVWRDGAGWVKENIPLPPSYASLSDPMSTSPCAAVDDQDRLHVVFAVAFDYLLKEPEPTDYLGALAHAVWSPSLGWESSTVIRADIGGDLSPKELGAGCELERGADGTLHLVYLVRDAGENPLAPQLFYGRESGAGWSFTDLGALAGSIRDVSHVDSDAVGNAYVALNQGASVDLLRIDPAGSVHIRSLPAYFSVGAGVSVWSPSPAETTCQVLQTKRFSPEEVQFLHTRIENCDEP